MQWYQQFLQLALEHLHGLGGYGGNHQHLDMQLCKIHSGRLNHE